MGRFSTDSTGGRSSRSSGGRFSSDSTGGRSSDQESENEDSTDSDVEDGRFDVDPTGGRPSDEGDSTESGNTGGSDDSSPSIGSVSGRFSSDPTGGRSTSNSSEKSNTTSSSDSGDSSSGAEGGRFGSDPTGGRPSDSSSNSDSPSDSELEPSSGRFSTNPTGGRERSDLSETNQRDNSTLAEIEKESFDPTSRDDVEDTSLKNVDEEQRQQLVEQASDELGTQPDNIEFGRRDDQIIAYRDPDTAAADYGNDLEERFANQLGLDENRVEYNRESSTVELTDFGRMDVQRRAKNKAAKDIEDFSPGDLTTDLSQGGSIEVNVRGDSARRELVDQIENENPEVDTSDIEFERDDGKLSATFSENSDNSAPDPDPAGVTKNEVSTLIGEASSPRDLADATVNIGGEIKDQAVEQQLGEEFLVDPRETSSATEFGSDLTKSYEEDVIEVKSTDDAVSLVTNPLEFDAEDLSDNPGQAGDDLLASYQEETGVTRSSLSDAQSTIMSPSSSTGAAGSAALVGIATPEPTTTAGGLLLGTAVVGATAINQNQEQAGELGIPDQPTQERRSELGVGGTTTETSEVSVPDEAGSFSEVSVPEDASSMSDGEIGIPDSPVDNTDPTTLQTGTQQKQRRKRITEETEDPRELDEGDFIIADESTLERTRQEIIRDDLERQQRLWDINTDEPRDIETGESTVVDGTGVRDSFEEGLESPMDTSQGQRVELGQNARTGPTERGISGLGNKQSAMEDVDNMLDQTAQLDLQNEAEMFEDTVAVESLQTKTQFDTGTSTATRTPKPGRPDLDLDENNDKKKRRQSDFSSFDKRFEADVADPNTLLGGVDNDLSDLETDDF